jgi:hypothetical protein
MDVGFLFPSRVSALFDFLDIDFWCVVVDRPLCGVSVGEKRGALADCFAVGRGRVSGRQFTRLV